MQGARLERHIKGEKKIGNWSWFENPFSMTHAALPPELKKAQGIEPGGIRLSIGLEDWRDIIEDLRNGLEQI